jgi:hypothetical protein
MRGIEVDHSMLMVPIPARSRTSCGRPVVKERWPVLRRSGRRRGVVAGIEKAAVDAGVGRRRQ